MQFYYEFKIKISASLHEINQAWSHNWTLEICMEDDFLKLEERVQ